MRAEDVVALRHLVDRYAGAVDERDIAALAGVFAGDGVVRVQADGGPVQGEWAAGELAGILDQVSRYETTFHHVGGCVFRDGADAGTATGTVHCMAHHYDRTGNGPIDLVMMIVYHDRYSSPEGEWRIAERRVAVQWTELHPAHPRRRVGS